MQKKLGQVDLVAGLPFIKRLKAFKASVFSPSDECMTEKYILFVQGLNITVYIGEKQGRA